MSKNNYVMPPGILEVLGPPPLLGSENPKRWNETLARYAQSYPPKDADDFEGWRNVWNLACDLPPATDADYAEAFAENMHIYCCADQIQNSARKRYDAVRDQIDLRRAAELASKMVNGEVTPIERQLQSGEVSSVEQLSESAPATTSVLLSSIQQFTPDASVTETLMSVRSMQLLEPPNSPEPQGSSEVTTASVVDAASAMEPLSIAVGETSRSASSARFLEVPSSFEPQESSEASTASAMDVMPAIEPSTAVGEGGPARVPPGMDTNNIENNNVVTDPSLAAPPAAHANSPGTSVTSTAVAGSVGSVIAGAAMPEPTPAVERNDERDRVESPGALVQPSQEHQVAPAQKESEADRRARIGAWIRKEIARRDAARARGPSR
jgi:hypothetical protein